MGGPGTLFQKGSWPPEALKRLADAQVDARGGFTGFAVQFKAPIEPQEKGPGMETNPEPGGFADIEGIEFRTVGIDIAEIREEDGAEQGVKLCPEFLLIEKVPGK